MQYITYIKLTILLHFGMVKIENITETETLAPQEQTTCKCIVHGDSLVRINNSFNIIENKNKVNGIENDIICGDVLSSRHRRL